MSARAVGRLYVVIAALSWGTSATLARSVFRDAGVPPLQVVELRVAIATLLARREEAAAAYAALADKQVAAGDSVRGLVTQQGVPLHQAMIAMEEASVSFQLMVEVRNKLLESYQELMRMQV